MTEPFSPEVVVSTDVEAPSGNVSTLVMEWLEAADEELDCDEAEEVVWDDVEDEDVLEGVNADEELPEAARDGPAALGAVAASPWPRNTVYAVDPPHMSLPYPLQGTLQLEESISAEGRVRRQKQ